MHLGAECIACFGRMVQLLSRRLLLSLKHRERTSSATSRKCADRIRASFPSALAEVKSCCRRHTGRIRTVHQAPNRRRNAEVATASVHACRVARHCRPWRRLVGVNIAPWSSAHAPALAETRCAAPVSACGCHWTPCRCRPAGDRQAPCESRPAAALPWRWSPPAHSPCP